ncbi:Uncharacterised protein [Raoultella ornithinolytica]|nr:Uncharacterised protein [Raoultella ornithinolytica]
MVTGPFINAGAVLLGGVLGALFKPTIAGADSDIDDLYFWSGLIGDWYPAGS